LNLYDFFYNFLGKLADDDTIMNKLVFNDEATFRLSDLTPIDFFLLGFVYDNVYVPQLLTTLDELKKTDQRGLCKH
jgi:ABC-type thiamine transport system substrate-binding protein